MLRTLATSSRSVVRISATSRVNTVLRISTTSRRSAGDHHAPPGLLGEGAPHGTVPTEVNQSTGLERLQILGHMDGVDVFDLQPLEVTRLGTKTDPILVKSYAPLRQVGCTGFPVDSHDTLWLNLSKDKKHSRCPECGSVYAMDYQGAEHDSHHH